jgi:ribose/xylose/arabinose/galactoside ABC-type transport system permease subunit
MQPHGLWHVFVMFITIVGSMVIVVGGSAWLTYRFPTDPSDPLWFTKNRIQGLPLVPVWLAFLAVMYWLW